MRKRRHFSQASQGSPEPLGFCARRRVQQDRWLTCLVLCLLAGSVPVSAQTTATLAGLVADPQGAAVPGARVTLRQPVTGFSRELFTSSEGTYRFVNLPLQTYTVEFAKSGFEGVERTVSLQTNVPVTVDVRLSLAVQGNHVQVVADDGNALLETEATGTRISLDVNKMERLPLPANSRGLEAALLSLPGFAADANGAIHPRGAHNQMTYVVDGMPISDQLTGAFANGVDPSVVQNVELYTGNVPPEFGAKISGVAVITTRTGLGSGQRFSGSTQTGAAQFDTVTHVTQVAGGGERWGYFASFSALKSNRYLDQVALENLQNGGNSERAFTRLDWQPTARNQLRVNLMAGRSSFQLANLPSQHAAGQEQRQMLRDLSVGGGWLRTLDAQTTLDTTLSYRTATAHLLPSAGDTPVTASQARRLTTIIAGTRYSAVRGRHTWRGGVEAQHFPVRERFTFAVTDPGFNDPGQAGYLPTLAPFDLSRGGELFRFAKEASGSLYAGFVQDAIKSGRWMFSLGLRYDAYRFLVHGAQWQPRVGVALSLPEVRGALRLSYNRNYQTPVNENLLISNSPESAVLVPPSVREALGGAFVRIRPQEENVYEAGWQQAVGRLASVNAAYYHKDSRNLHDNDNFFNTGIIFPTSLARARVNGAELRLVTIPVRGWSGTLSLTHYHAVVTPPFTGGLFLGSTAIDALSAGPFVIDHDQRLGAQGVVLYSIKKNLWVSTSVRYDSGLVSNPTSPERVRSDPDYAALLPYVDFSADPQRVRPRTLVDIGVGYEWWRNDKRRWDLQATASNIGNVTALYNFQSIFVGTRLVAPRTAGVKWRVYF